MSDLISRSKLLNIIDNDILKTNEWIDKHKNVSTIYENKLRELYSQLTTLKAYRLIIEDQPIAYDVDKVVEELEKQLLVVEIEDEYIVPESDVDEYFELDVVPMVDAREIVRKGGV